MRRAERRWPRAAQACMIAVLWGAALLLTAAVPAAAQAQTSGSTGIPADAQAAADPALEARVMRLAAELRCLVCQNQTIADSNADLAVDLRQQVRELLQQGRSEREVMDYMTARYGDFVLYRPPLKSTTALLWFGPLLLLGVGALVLFLVVRRRSRLGPEHFEAEIDPASDDDLPGPGQPPTTRAP